MTWLDELPDDEVSEYVALRMALAGHRWPWQPLGDLLGGTLRTQAEALGVHQRQVSRWRSYGLTDAQADRCAIVAGVHPTAVWDDWDDVLVARPITEVA